MGVVDKFTRNMELLRTSLKQYDPHVIVVWTSQTTVAVKEYSYKEDAEEKYNELAQLGAMKVVLAKIVKSHGEG